MYRVPEILLPWPFAGDCVAPSVVVALKHNLFCQLGILLICWWLGVSVPS